MYYQVTKQQFHPITWVIRPNETFTRVFSITKYAVCITITTFSNYKFISYNELFDPSRHLRDYSVKRNMPFVLLLQLFQTINASHTTSYSTQRDIYESIQYYDMFIVCMTTWLVSSLCKWIMFGIKPWN